MQTVNLIQGSPQWLEHRNTHFNASDIAVVMGLSSYKTRDQLLHEYATGERPEIDPMTQKRFDLGHKYEAMAREIIEQEDGIELFPVVAVKEIDGLKLSASLDGVDMFETENFEHKSINEKLREVETIEQLDKQYHVQMEQQCMVSEVDKCLFVASDGTKENRIKLKYTHDQELANDIMLAWHQFAKDLEAYEVKPQKVSPVSKRIETLPSLAIEFKGAITFSNLNEFKQNAISFIDNINKDLQTDQNFADAESDIKTLKQAEKQLKDVENNLMSGTADLADTTNMIKHLKIEAKDVRIMLEKLVKAEKQNRKLEIANAAKQSYEIHVQELEKELQGMRLQINAPNWNDALKNKRTISSLGNAANSRLAEVKIEADQAAKKIRANLALFDSLTGASNIHLFNDKARIIALSEHDLKEVIKSRLIAEDNRIEAAKKAEAERIEFEAEQQKQIEAEALLTQQKEEQERIDNNKPNKPNKATETKRASIQANAETKKSEIITDPVNQKNELSLAQQINSLCDAHSVDTDFQNDLFAILDSFDIVLPTAA